MLTKPRRLGTLLLPLCAAAAALPLPTHAAAQVAPADPARFGGAWEGALLTPDRAIALSFTLRRNDDGWAGTFSLPAEAVRDFPLAGITLAGDSLVLVLRGDGQVTFRGRLAADTIAGVFRNGSRTTAATFARPGSPTAERLAAAVRQASQNARRAPLAEVGRGPAYGRVDAGALERLLGAARDAHSDALVVLHDGELVGAWYSDGQPRRIETMSATKSIVNLAVGRLVTLGRIESLDVPVSEFYPEWSTGRKARVTLRHLLNHTSGIESQRTTEEIYASRDFVRLALDAEITSEPGSRFFYNNKAVNLVAGIVEKAAGRKLDDFMKADLFATLGITDVAWSRDGAGNPHGMSGLQIRAEDLAKLGQLVLDRGRWNGEQLIAEGWFDESLRPGSPHGPTSGLLWWLIPADTVAIIDDTPIRELRDAGADSAFIAALEAVRGRYPSVDSLTATLARTFGDDWRSVVNSTLAPLGVQLTRYEFGRTVGYQANGYLGQYLVIYPEKRLVAVRMVEASSAYDPDTDGLRSFFDLVYLLVP